jgi:glycosyltransferase involved in cell wall biosynthesis
MREQLINFVKELGLVDRVLFFKPVPVRQVAELMANADLGVVPKRADSFGNEAYSTKIMEFMSLGIPVVVSSTKIDRFYFDDSVVRFFPSGDHEALAEAIISIIHDNNLRDNMVSKASEYAQLNSWEIRKNGYLSLVDSLIASGRGGDEKFRTENRRPEQDQTASGEADPKVIGKNRAVAEAEKEGEVVQSA